VTPERKILALRIAMAVPYAFALLVVFWSLVGGQAIIFAGGWLAIQTLGYGLILKRYGVDPDQPILFSQIAIHWMMMIMLLTILVKSA
jgi:hypothetical protein